MNADIKGNLLFFPVFLFVILLRWWTLVLNMAKFQIITSAWPFYGHLTFSLSEITEVIGKKRELRVRFRLQTGQMLVSALYLAQNALFFSPLSSWIVYLHAAKPSQTCLVYTAQITNSNQKRSNIAYRYLQTHTQIQSVFAKIRGVKRDSPAVTPHEKRIY